VVGILHRCTECPDFDLCDNCYQDLAISHTCKECEGLLLVNSDDCILKMLHSGNWSEHRFLSIPSNIWDANNSVPDSWFIGMASPVDRGKENEEHECLYIG